jgi:hypothetical protein
MLLYQIGAAFSTRPRTKAMVKAVDEAPDRWAVAMITAIGSTARPCLIGSWRGTLEKVPVFSLTLGCGVANHAL